MYDNFSKLEKEEWKKMIESKDNNKYEKWLKYQNVWKEIVMLSYKSIWWYNRDKGALLFNTFVRVFIV